jgi:parallel beta-helix repeat protein
VNTALTVKDNTITGNQIGLYISNCYPSTFTGNNIVNNSVNAKMFTDNSGKSKDISVPNNWWGTTSTAAIDQSIYDFNDDFSLGKVNYTPILTQENTAAYPDSSVSIPSTTPSPTLTPTTEPITNPTFQPTVSPTPNTSLTSNPSDNSSQSILSVDWVTAAIIGLLALIEFYLP